MGKLPVYKVGVPGRTEMLLNLVCPAMYQTDPSPQQAKHSSVTVGSVCAQSIQMKCLEIGQHLSKFGFFPVPHIDIAW